MTAIRPRHGMYHDELDAAATYVSGGYTVTTEAIINFATVWDPQPFHVDIPAAERSLFGGLVGSGLQSLLLAYRLYYDLGLLHGTVLAGLGMQEVKFLAPLRTGDTVHVLVSVDSLRPSSRPDRGVVVWFITLKNQADEAILSLKLSALVARRTPEQV